ncbi:PQQ-dependent sugar dehydrogenase [Pusillimonas sp. TS35]|uniref:PQQ-dependent sugar dehydrogenase n=1 Tax=Paracandidimonas lactea TaxID=2895524 RepID=UPI001367B009|nr:PQQ-dependent sugar dehydrogenase [Paracandidimonas lactea]MYN12118.1 PQQ-dependent sugar dehydrogenase [Pusillimonas sp. TS35]
MQWHARDLRALGIALCGLAGLWRAAPAAAVQHDAPAVRTPGDVVVEVLAEGLTHPWGMAFLPADAGVLITERPGTLRLWRAEQGLSAPLAGVPGVYAHGQGGLLDIALAPDFAQSRRVYLSYAERGDQGKAGTAVGYGVLAHDLTRLENFRVIFRQQPKLSTGEHFGSRLVFDRNGHLFVTLGENNQRPTAQQLDKLQGKVVRILPDGGIPADNPFVGRSDARPEIWSYGHRNPQGAALNPWTGVLWVNEHGARGGDEINIPRASRNYGWPIATHGVNYTGFPIPESKGAVVAGTEQPAYYWKESPAISGMAFYAAERFSPWQYSVFIGALKDRALIRLSLDGNDISGEEWLLESRRQRIRDVRVGPDGYVYVLTDESDGQLLKLGLK